MSGREKKGSADHIRLLFLIFVSAVCVLFLLKLRCQKPRAYMIKIRFVFTVLVFY